jgi:hypothetical protein
MGAAVSPSGGFAMTDFVFVFSYELRQTLSRDTYEPASTVRMGSRYSGFCPYFVSGSRTARLCELSIRGSP